MHRPNSSLKKDIILRPFQAKAIRALKELYAHVICVSKTGSGKSLIYENHFNENPSNNHLLITPLVALGRQQKSTLSKLSTHYIVNDLSELQLTNELKKIIFVVSPEKLKNPYFIKKLLTLNIHTIVIDECHCLWEWGETFRPAYLEVFKLFEKIKFKNSLWLTATLPPHYRKQLKSSISGKIVEIGRFEFPSNIDLSFKHSTHLNRMNELIHFIHKQKNKSGIVFVQTRAMAEKIYNLFYNYSSVFYHAGISKEEKKNIENLISNNQIQVVVATSAFGMGMNFTQFNWVVLWQVPLSLLDLVQKVGRIGRNNTAGNALILWHEDDFKLIKWLTKKLSQTQKAELIQVVNLLNHKGDKIKYLEHYFLS